MKTERMTILVTPEQKAAILARAERLGLSAGEMVRRAVESYDPAAGSDEDQAVLDALADELFAAGSPADLVDCYARKLPLSVICELLGLPLADRAKFTAWATSCALRGFTA